MVRAAIPKTAAFNKRRERALLKQGLQEEILPKECQKAD